MTIPTLPLPPSTLDPPNFRARGDEFFLALFDFATECNTFSGEFDTAYQAVMNAVNATVWTPKTYNIGDRVYDPTNGLLYLCTTAHTSGTAQYPNLYVPSRWALQTVGLPPLTVVSTATSSGSPYPLVKNSHVELSNTAQGWARLPVPAVGDWVLVGFTNDRRDNVLMPHSGGKIMKAAANENMTLNHINPTLMCRYVDTTIGWKVLMR